MTSPAEFIPKAALGKLTIAVAMPSLNTVAIASPFDRVVIT
jgi:hypothetical protein